MMPGGHHLMLIRVHLDHVTFLDRSVSRSRTRSGPPWTPSRPPGESAPTASPARSPAGAASLPAAERLAEIPGVSPELARAIIAETGLTLDRFWDHGHQVFPVRHN